MYIIQTKVLDCFNYFLSTFQGKDKEYCVWEGLKQNGKKFKDKQEAADFAFAYTTLPTEIIPV